MTSQAKKCRRTRGVVVVVRRRGIGAGDADLEPGFFQAFADRGRLRAFRRVRSFAAGKFPKAGQRRALGALTDQELPVVLDDGDGDFDWRGRAALSRAVISSVRRAAGPASP